MSAFLFTGWTSQFKAGRFGDSCVSSIIYGGSLEHARTSFEQWLLSANQAEDPVPTKIEKIVAAPVLEHLFTEAGPVPMDWAQVCEDAARAPEVGAEETFEQGYWVDCNAVIRPDDLSLDLESLRGDLPEDIRSGLNWSGEKHYFYVVSALSPAAPPPEVTYDEDGNPVAVEPPHPEEGEPASFHLTDRGSAFPELVDKEVAVVVRARNSVVAAWLWRRHAANTALARNNIRVDPWFGAGSVEPES